MILGTGLMYDHTMHSTMKQIIVKALKVASNRYT